MATDRIDARDVLDPNAKTARGFRARVVGQFRRVGPNPWDDYRFEAVEDGESVDVLADVPIHVETERAEFRMRKAGAVLRLAWLPEADACDPGAADVLQRERFLADCCRPFAEAAGIGAAAGIAKALATRTPKPSID